MYDIWHEKLEFILLQLRIIYLDVWCMCMCVCVWGGSFEISFFFLSAKPFFSLLVSLTNTKEKALPQ